MFPQTAKTISIGSQSFQTLREKELFYVDKTGFIRDWWKSEDQVTLIARPSRFGKTLNMNMMECFFSMKYRDRSDLFDGLEVWQDETMRREQGAWPVIFLSFANVKQARWSEARKVLNEKLMQEKDRYRHMMDDPVFSENDRETFRAIRKDMDDATASTSLYNLCEWLERYYGKKALIFLDEYDTPMQEAWLQGYWDEMATYIRNLFNGAFKTNPSLGRAILTGITRISKESIFSDLNNLTVITTTSGRYATAFGFTEEEVFASLEAQGYPQQEKAKVKEWYDGFNFGMARDIYNPWSVTNFLKTGEYKAWWANSSGNGLISRLLRRGNPMIKQQFESLLKGEMLTLPVNEEIAFNQLDEDAGAIWSLMLAAGYLKAVIDDSGKIRERSMLLTLAVTNKETLDTLEDMVRAWFSGDGCMPQFLRAMLKGDAKTMGRYLNDILIDTVSYFDSGKKPSSKEPENFYHGLVLGLVAEKSGEYYLRSNRESGYGRYDVVMEPKDPSQPAVIMEFKVFDPEDEENSLEDTAKNALRQIEEIQYDRELLARGIPPENIRKYGIAFEGKKCIVR